MLYDEFVYIKTVDLYDDKVFTPDDVADLRDHMINCSEDVFKELTENIEIRVQKVEFSLIFDIMEEALVDAIIGLRNRMNNEYSDEEQPNAFKIISYLAYWWLRHKPAILTYDYNANLDDLIIPKGEFEDDQKRDKRKQELIWRFKHVNELIAVHMVSSYLFDFSKPLCDESQCDFIKGSQGTKFCFETFEEMKEVLLRKLTYYFSYRTISPKVIEHILEGYTFHPAWELTGAHWQIESLENAER